MTNVINKKATAAQIFMEMKSTGTTRKEILFLFQEKAGLTANGASTYYANFNGGCWSDAVSGKSTASVATNKQVQATTKVDFESMGLFELTQYFNQNCALFKIDRFSDKNDAIEMITKYCK